MFFEADILSRNLTRFETFKVVPSENISRPLGLETMLLAKPLCKNRGSMCCRFPAILVLTKNFIALREK
jgi:hypothetical protein